MSDNFWFSSILIDAEGYWRGRFLRANGPVEGAGASLTEFLRNFVAAADDEPDIGQVFVPASALTEPGGDAVVGWTSAADANPGACIWLNPGENIPSSLSPRYLAHAASGGPYATESAAGCQLVVLDTGERADWCFAATGAPALADISHLRHRPRKPSATGDRSKPQLLSLLSLVTRDADNRELEKAFRSDPELAYHLLRLVNSVGICLTHPVSSLSNAITVVGRRQLQRWLQLLIYVNTAAGREKPNPLLQLTAYRGRLLELLAAPEDDPDSAYIVGIFSLLDCVLPQTMPEILAKLPIQPSIREALCERRGRFGRLLAACEAAEVGHLDQSARMLNELGVEPERWLQFQNLAYEWAFTIGREIARPSAS